MNTLFNESAGKLNKNHLQLILIHFKQFKQFANKNKLKSFSKVFDEWVKWLGGWKINLIRSTEKKIVKVLCCFAKLCIELELLFFFFGNNYNRLRIVEEKKKDLHVWILISIIHRDVWNSSHPWLSDDAKPLTNASRLKDSLGENEPFTNFNWTFWPLLIAIYCVRRVYLTKFQRSFTTKFS